MTRFNFISHDDILTFFYTFLDVVVVVKSVKSGQKAKINTIVVVGVVVHVAVAKFGVQIELCQVPTLFTDHG